MVAMAAFTALGNLGAGCFGVDVGESLSRLFLMREPITKSWFVRLRSRRGRKAGKTKVRDGITQPHIT